MWHGVSKSDPLKEQRQEWKDTLYKASLKWASCLPRKYSGSTMLEMVFGVCVSKWVAADVGTFCRVIRNLMGSICDSM